MTYARPTQPLHVVDVLVEGFRLFWTGISSLFVPAFLFALIVGVMNPISSLAYAALGAISYSLGVCVTYSLYQDLRLRQTPTRDVRPTD